MKKTDGEKLPKPGDEIYVSSAFDNHPVIVLRIINRAKRELLVCEYLLPATDPARVYKTVAWSLEPTPHYP